MACCLPFLSGILPRSTHENKLLLDVRGGAIEDDDAGTPTAGFLGWFGGGGAKSSDPRARVAEVEEEGPHEAYYRIWYGKGLLCFKPKSLGGSGVIPAARRFDEMLDVAASAGTGSTTNGEAATGDEATDSPMSYGDTPSKRGHDWSKQTLVESTSQAAGRSLHSYWEERSSTTTMATPESLNTLKVVQVDQ